MCFILISFKGNMYSICHVTVKQNIPLLESHVVIVTVYIIHSVSCPIGFKSLLDFSLYQHFFPFLPVLCSLFNELSLLHETVLLLCCETVI